MINVIRHCTFTFSVNVLGSCLRVLCETVKDFLARVGVSAATEDPQVGVSAATEDPQVRMGAATEDPIAHKCSVLNEKLDALLKTLENECDDSMVCTTTLTHSTVYTITLTHVINTPNECDDSMVHTITPTHAINTPNE